MTDGMKRTKDIGRISLACRSATVCWRGHRYSGKHGVSRGDGGGAQASCSGTVNSVNRRSRKRESGTSYFVFGVVPLCATLAFVLFERLDAPRQAFAALAAGVALGIWLFRLRIASRMGVAAMPIRGTRSLRCPFYEREYGRFRGYRMDRSLRRRNQPGRGMEVGREKVEGKGCKDPKLLECRPSLGSG